MPTPPHIMTPEQAAEHLKALAAQKAELREINREIAENERAGIRITDVLKEQQELLKAKVSTMEKSKQINAAELYKVQQQIEGYKQLLETKQNQWGDELSHFAQKRIAESLEQAHAEAINREAQHLLELNAEGLLQDDTRLRIVLKEVQELKMKPIYEKQVQGFAAGTSKIMAGYAKHPMFNVGNLRKLTGMFAALRKSPKEFFKGLATGLLSNFVNSVVALVFEMNKAEAAFTKSTGASKKFKSNMREVYSEVRGAAVGMEQFYQTTGELFKTFTDFTQISQEASQEVAKVTATMVQAGHSAGALAKDMQALSIAFGMTATEASDTLMELDAFARDIGVAPAQLTQQFGAMSSGLAKLGSEGVDAFKDLARVSKITGFEMAKLLRMTDKFDTFEGAAEQAGKLNAALGGNFVNAMDMMTATDPVERFEMMRNSLLDAGLEFDNMSYYQRKFFADSLGLEGPADLAAMMRGDMESLGAEMGKNSAEYEVMANRAREAADFQERFKAILQKLIPVFTPLIDAIDMMLMSVEELGSNTSEFTPEAIEMKGVLDGVLGSLKQMGSLVLWVVQNWKKALALFVLVKIGIWAITTAMAASSSGMVGFALALNLVQTKKLLAMAAGFTLMALSVAALAIAFSKMDIKHMVGLAATLILLGVGIYYLAPAIATIGAAATATAPGLWTLAAVIIAIGAAVGLAAMGVGLMAEGFAVWFEAINIEKMAAFALFVGGLFLMGKFMPIIGIGLAWLAGGIGALWLVMMLMPRAKVNAFTDFLTSLGNLTDFTNLDLAITKIKEIKEVVSELPNSKMVAVTGMMTAMAAPAMMAMMVASQAQSTAPARLGREKQERSKEQPLYATIAVKLDGKVIAKHAQRYIAQNTKAQEDAFLKDEKVMGL